MKTKTFKIGEYCKGGVITAITTPATITLIGKDWDLSAGTKKSSNQSNAKEFARIEIPNDGRNQQRMFEFLTDLTTVYYADKVINWVNAND